jgi:hypothetical protein
MKRGLDRAHSQGDEKVYRACPPRTRGPVRFLEDRRWKTGTLPHAHYKVGGAYVAEQMMAVMLKQP